MTGEICDLHDRPLDECIREDLEESCEEYSYSEAFLVRCSECGLISVCNDWQINQINRGNQEPKEKFMCDYCKLENGSVEVAEKWRLVPEVDLPQKWECDKCGNIFYGEAGNDTDTAFCSFCGSLKTNEVE